MSYLANHPLLASKDLSELRQHLADVNSIEKIEVVGKGVEIDTEVCGVSFAGLDLVNFQYGGALTQFHACAGPEVMQMIVTATGSGQADYGKECFDMTRDVGFMRDMSKEHVSSLEGIEALALFLPLDKLATHARTLAGEKADMIAPKFEMNFDMTTREGIHLRNTLDYISVALNETDLKNDLILKSFGDLLLTGILTLIPNSYSDILRDRPRSSAIPGYLKRATDFIHANIDTSISLEDLARQGGCSYRTLQQAFNEAYDMSPMAYIKNLRLNSVRKQLIEADGGMSIRDIAQKWGFTHMGRFSDDYRKKFGILPSATRRQRS